MNLGTVSIREGRWYVAESWASRPQAEGDCNENQEILNIKKKVFQYSYVYNSNYMPM